MTFDELIAKIREIDPELLPDHGIHAEIGNLRGRSIQISVSTFIEAFEDGYVTIDGNCFGPEEWKAITLLRDYALEHFNVEDG